MDGLYVYALVSTIYDEKGDYIDCFLPFVLSVIDSQISNTLNEIKDRVRDKYHIEIPSHSLTTILKRAKHQDYLTKQNNQFHLSDEGKQFNDAIEEKQTKREFNSFLDKLKEYVKQQGGDVEEVEDAFQQYITYNLRALSYFIDADAYSLGKIKNRKKVFSHITSFIIQIENSNPQQFKIFENIVFGKIIALAMQGTTDISELQQHFSKTTLFLDSNVVFDILGFQGNESQKATIEFIKLTQKINKFALKVFDFTVEEIIRVISYYPSQSKKYITSVRVDCVYYHLKLKGWKNSDVSHFIQNVEQILLKNNLKICRTDKFIITAEYKGKERQLAKYKPGGWFPSYKHDLRAIAEIEKMRSGKVRKFEKAVCFFVSQDTRLAKFNFKEYEHKGQQSIPEVVLEYAFTNLLWMKEPKEIPLNALISFQKRYAVVKENIWKVFYGKILEAKEEDKDFYNDTTTLLSHNQLQSALSALDEEATEEDIERVIREDADFVRQHEEEERKDLLSKQHAEIEKKFDEQIAEVKTGLGKILSEQRNKNVEALIQVRNKVIMSANDNSDIVWNVFRVIIFLIIIVAVLIFLPKIVEDWARLEPILWLCSVVISMLFLISGFKWVDIKPKLDEYFKKKKLKEIQFEELLKSLDVIGSEIDVPNEHDAKIAQEGMVVVHKPSYKKKLALVTGAIMLLAAIATILGFVTDFVGKPKNNELAGRQIETPKIETTKKEKLPKKDEEDKISIGDVKGDVVISKDQSGGITAHTVNVNQQRAISPQAQTKKEKRGDSFILQLILSQTSGIWDSSTLFELQVKMSGPYETAKIVKGLPSVQFDVRITENKENGFFGYSTRTAPLKDEPIILEIQSTTEIDLVEWQAEPLAENK